MASKNVSSKWVSGNLVFYDASGNVLCTFDGTNRKLTLPSGAVLDVSAATLLGGKMVLNTRTRTTTANVNAGATLLAAVAGLKYRLVNVHVVAVGGSASAVTTVDILGTQGASGVKLVTFAQANLTQSTVLGLTSTGATVLADGASFVACDANTAITIGKTGASLATATNIDVSLSYTLEP